MNETDQFTVGAPLPRIAQVEAADELSVAVTWATGEREVVDLAPELFRYKLYAPLRDHPALFRSAHVDAWGTQIAWGDGAISMPAVAVEALASQAMTPADFKAFLARHKLTLDAAAAQLGVSRRQAAYYAASKAVPRTVALACAYLDERMAPSNRGLATGLQQPS